MKNSATMVYNAVLVVGDFLALVFAFVGAFILRVKIDSRPLPQPIDSKTYLGVFLTLLPFWIIIFALLGLYNNSVYEKRFAEIGRLFIGSFVGMLFVVFWNFIATNPILPARLVPIYGFILAFIFLTSFRNIARLVRTILFGYNIGLTNVLIIGNTRLTNELVGGLYNSKMSGYKIVGIVGRNAILENKYPRLKFFDDFESAKKRLGLSNIYSIIQTELFADDEKNRQILEFAQVNHIGYKFTPSNNELFVGNLEVELFRSSIPIIAVHQTALLGWGRIVKRLFDVIIGTLLLIIFSPILLLTAISIKIFGGNGGVFFRQVRLTRFNHKFTVYKFRTANTTYNGLTHEQAFQKMGKPELLKVFHENGEYLPNDPRYTKIGLFLRKTSLDELPQLINVIRGDISLVGPRALVPQELDSYGKRHTILSVKSGLTGLAQVSGRRNISFDERRKLDMYYVQNWSFWFDIVILLKTIRAVFSRTGAK